MVLGDLLESDLLEIEDDIGDILLYSGNGVQFMRHSVDSDGVDGETAQRRKENPPEGVSDCLAITGLKRLEFELSEETVRFKHHDLVGFLKC